MVIKPERLFVEQFAMCPINFQEKFRKIYQQLKIVDSPTEVKEVSRTKEKDFFRLYIDKSRIGMHKSGTELRITCFLYNQFFDGNLEV